MRSIFVVDDDQAINKMVREYLVSKDIARTARTLGRKR